MMQANSSHPLRTELRERIRKKPNFFLFRLFAWYFFKMILKYGRKYTTTSKNIIHSNPDIKDIELKVIRYYEIRCATVKYWDNLFTVPANIFFFLGVMGSVFITPWAVKFYLKQPLNFDKYLDIIAFLLPLLLNVLLLVFVLRCVVLLASLSRSLSLLSILFLIIALSVTISRLLLYNPSFVVFFLLSISISQMFLLILLILYLISLTFIRNISIRLLRNQYPDAFVIHKLIRIIGDLVNKTKLWVDVSFRRQLLMELEDISSCIEKDLFRKLKSGDKTTDFFIRTSFGRIAAAFREKKLWIITPKLDTRLLLAKNLSKSLFELVIGSWDELEQKDPKKLSIRRDWFEYFKDILNFIMIGVAPILFLWIIQKSSLALVSPLKDYMVGGAILWVIITAVLTFDPFGGIKLEALRDTIKYLPFIGKK